jgi:hypothetical protein
MNQYMEHLQWLCSKSCIFVRKLQPPLIRSNLGFLFGSHFWVTSALSPAFFLRPRLSDGTRFSTRAAQPYPPRQPKPVAKTPTETPPLRDPTPRQRSLRPPPPRDPRRATPLRADVRGQIPFSQRHIWRSRGSHHRACRGVSA